MGSVKRDLAIAALLIASCVAPSALAAETERVNVYSYAMDHPIADADLRAIPSLGASVPATVQIVTVSGETIYGYFYYGGRPIIVEMSTRSVVRVDD